MPEKKKRYIRANPARVVENPHNVEALQQIQKALTNESTQGDVPPVAPKKKHKSKEPPPPAPTLWTEKHLKEVRVTNTRSRFYDADDALVGEAHYLPAPQEDPKLELLRQRAYYRVREILKGTALALRGIEIGAVAFPEQHYNDLEDLLTESRLSIRCSHGAIKQNGPAVAAVLTQLLGHPVTYQVSHDAATPFHYLDNISLEEIARLNQTELLAGNRIAQDMLGTKNRAR